MFTMGTALVRAATHFGDRTAMVSENGSGTSWRDHVSRVSRLAGALRSWGLLPGKRFAIIAQNSVAQAELIHAGYWSGAIPVPVNYRLAVPEIAAVLAESGASVLFVATPFEAMAVQLLAAGWNGTLLTVGEQGTYPGCDQAIAQHDPVDAHSASETDEAILLFTGGTTGSGKGVPLSHRNIVSNGFQVGLALGVNLQDRFLHVAPMFHSADLLGTAVTLVGGAHDYLGAPAPDSFVDTVESHRTTITMVPPVLLHGLVNASLLSGRNLKRLRVFISGGAPVAYELLDQAQAYLPAGSMVQGYGLTETSPILSFMHLGHTLATTEPQSTSAKSAGLPLADVEMRLVNDQWEDVAAGQPGELTVRGPNVFSGYLNRPGDTAAALKDEWFRTGDVARFDSNGYLYIIDRSKDVIITGGENVYSAEVETILAEHPDVAEAAVVGAADDKWGERVVAVVVARNSSLTENALIGFCRGQIAGYKTPRRCIFVNELPKTPLGKVAKADLRQLVSTNS